jgi:hypothetical protein
MEHRTTHSGAAIVGTMLIGLSSLTTTPVAMAQTWWDGQGRYHFQYTFAESNAFQYQWGYGAMTLPGGIRGDGHRFEVACRVKGGLSLGLQASSFEQRLLDYMPDTIIKPTGMYGTGMVTTHGDVVAIGQRLHSFGPTVLFHVLPYQRRRTLSFNISAHVGLTCDLLEEDHRYLLDQVEYSTIQYTVNPFSFSFGSGGGQPVSYSRSRDPDGDHGRYGEQWENMQRAGKRTGVGISFTAGIRPEVFITRYFSMFVDLRIRRSLVEPTIQGSMVDNSNDQYEADGVEAVRTRKVDISWERATFGLGLHF